MPIQSEVISNEDMKWCMFYVWFGFCKLPNIIKNVKYIIIKIKDMNKDYEFIKIGGKEHIVSDTDLDWFLSYFLIKSTFPNTELVGTYQSKTKLMLSKDFLSKNKKIIASIWDLEMNKQILNWDLTLQEGTQKTNMKNAKWWIGELLGSKEMNLLFIDLDIYLWPIKTIGNHHQFISKSHKDKQKEDKMNPNIFFWVEEYSNKYPFGTSLSLYCFNSKVKKFVDKSENKDFLIMLMLLADGSLNNLMNYTQNYINNWKDKIDFPLFEKITGDENFETVAKEFRDNKKDDKLDEVGSKYLKKLFNWIKLPSDFSFKTASKLDWLDSLLKANKYKEMIDILKDFRETLEKGNLEIILKLTKIEQKGNLKELKEYFDYISKNNWIFSYNMIFSDMCSITKFES